MGPDPHGSDVTSPHLLDTDRIRALRRDRGLSARTLESRLGVGGNWWNSLEAGANHPHVTLRELLTIAAELGVDPVELLADRVTQPELPPDAPQALSADATRLGRILVDLTRQTPVTRLATALGWSQARVQAALDVLEVRLPTVGQRLVHGTGGVQIVRDSPEPDPSVMELISARINDNGLSPTQAVVLARVTQGEMTERAASPALMTNAQSVALAELVNAGLVTPPAGRRGAYALCDRVRGALLLGQS